LPNPPTGATLPESATPEVWSCRRHCGSCPCVWPRFCWYPAPAQGPPPATRPTVNFDEFFVDRALRLELFQIGDAKEEIITLSAIYQEPLWPENPRLLLPPWEACRYAIEVYDPPSGRLIFQHGFDSLYGEYRTTTPAQSGVKKVFSRSVRLPEPRRPVRVVIARRDEKLALRPVLTLNVDPSDLHIIRESVDRGDWTFDVQVTGAPHDRVDLTFLAEGYTAADREKFRADVRRMAEALFAYEPYRANRERFNLRGVFRASPERGMDEPVQRRYRATALGASYNTFDTDRYLMVEDDHAVYRMAAQVPTDNIVVLVNTDRYGGGGITMEYCVTSVDHATSPRIFVHEFGHSFAALADEYVGGVAYNDMYPAGVEPLEVNITRLLDPANIKWKQFLTPGVALPTPAPARGGRAGVTTAPAAPVVGAFEGAGYLARGMYRPQAYCIMGTAGPDNSFCVVCRYGIQRMIDYYAPPVAPNP
jgi:hypothetical protein